MDTLYYIFLLIIRSFTVRSWGHARLVYDLSITSSNPSFLLQNDYSEQWALACGEVLRVLTHYNRPIYKVEHQNNEQERSNSGSHATTSNSTEGEACHLPLEQQERKPLRLLSPWITDLLLAAPLGIRSDYFRWLVNMFFYGVTHAGRLFQVDLSYECYV